MDSAERGRLQDGLTRLADGDREAFHPVFLTLRPLLRRFASRYLPDHEAEDVAQEALTKVFLRAAEFDSRRDALSWALGIAAFEIKTARRRRQRLREDDAGGSVLAALADPSPTPEDAAVARSLDHALDAALRALPPSDAATLRAFAEGERPVGVAAATFRKRVERGLARLRARWRAMHDRP